MTAPETVHQHQFRDKHGLPPVYTGTPPTGLRMELPVSCAGCDATSDELVASLDDHDHDVAITDGWLVASLVLPS